MMGYMLVPHYPLLIPIPNIKGFKHTGRLWAQNHFFGPMYTPKSTLNPTERFSLFLVWMLGMTRTFDRKNKKNVVFPYKEIVSDLIFAILLLSYLNTGLYNTPKSTPNPMERFSLFLVWMLGMTMSFNI